MALCLHHSAVDAVRAVEVVLALKEDHSITDSLYSNRVLLGLVREWLRDVLPADAHERCDSKFTVVVRCMEPWRDETVSTFATRQDLIDVVCASMTLPGLNHTGWSTLRTKPCMDPLLFTPPESSVVLVSPFRDAAVPSSAAVSFHDPYRLMICGREHAAFAPSVRRLRLSALASRPVLWAWYVVWLGWKSRRALTMVCGAALVILCRAWARPPL